MGLIRSDEVVALNDVIVAARDGAARLRAAIEDVEGEKAARLAAEADRLDARAETLADIVRAQDDLPHAPHDETLLIEQFITRLQTLFSDEEAVMDEVASHVDRNLQQVLAEARGQVRNPAALAAMDDLRLKV